VGLEGKGDATQGAVADAGLRELRRALANDQIELAATRERMRRMYGWPGVVSALGLLAVCPLAPLLPGYLVLHRIISLQTASWLIPALLLSSFAVGLLAILRWQSSRGARARAAETLAAAAVPVREPTSPAEVEQAVRGLERERRQARLATLAAERNAYAGIPSLMGYLDLIIGGSLLLPLGGAATVFSVRMLAGIDANEPWIWLLWAPTLAIVLVLVALRRRRARRRLAVHRALDQLAGDMGGQRLPRFADAVEWMNQFWAAAPVANALYRGAINGALAATLRRYPVLVDVEPDGASGEDVTIDPRVFVYVAAPVPASLPPTREVAAVAAALRGAGFEPELFPGAGVLARATGPALKILRREPARLAQLGPVVHDLVRLAEACEAPSIAR
jgi:hypothetical protein